MKLLVSRTGKVYAAGPRSVRKINSVDTIHRIKEIAIWIARFSI